MTRKERLKEIAKRCQDNELSPMSLAYYNQLSQMLYGTSDKSELFEKAFGQSLDAVADLEKELLPSDYQVQVFVDNVAVCEIYRKHIVDLVLNHDLVAMTDADTEPLARLAALCIVLVEMENDE